MNQPSPSHSSATTDRAFFTSVADLPGVEMLKACFLSHRFSPHTHDTWAFGAVVQGAHDFAARAGVPHVVGAGQISVIPPGEVHAGHALGDSACGFVTLYVPDETMRSFSADIGLNVFESGMRELTDSALASRMVCFIGEAMHTEHSTLSLSSSWFDLMWDLQRRWCGAAPREGSPAHGSAAMGRAFAYLNEHWAQPVTLDRLAQEADMSPSHFCRQFARTHGLSPHRYQVVLRVKRAKEMLARGIDIAQVAAVAGFADQSHLGRHLKGCFGVTPAQMGGRSTRTRTFFPSE